jgi:putative membrane protein
LIDYDRNAWFRVTFAWVGTVLPYVLTRVMLLTVISLLVLGIYEFFVPAQNGQKPALDPLGHQILGVALGMLIVFRTNSSHNRFWEARSLWGMMVNTTRSLARAAAAFAPPGDELARLIGAYVVMVREQLRGNKDPEVLRPLVPGRVLGRLRNANNPASVLAGLMSEWIVQRLRSGQIDTITATHMENLICKLLDCQGGCEKILKTPLPFVYSALIKQALLLYLATLPFVLVPRMGFMGVVIVAGVSLCMLGIEEAGVEIESPFGLDDNHLPLESICAMISRDASDLAEMVGPEAGGASEKELSEPQVRGIIKS